MKTGQPRTEPRGIRSALAPAFAFRRLGMALQEAEVRALRRPASGTQPTSQEPLRHDPVARRFRLASPASPPLHA